MTLMKINFFENNLTSVVMPVHNSEKFLRQSIDSVLQQVGVSLELVVVDDCSDDASACIISEYALVNSNIKVVRLEKNSGAGASRNAGIAAASGRYVAFIDSDDVWHPDKLSVQLKEIASTGAAICHASYSMIDESGAHLNGGVRASHVVDLHSYMKSTEIGLSTAVIDRCKITDLYFDVARTRQDTMLWLRLLGMGFISVGVENVLVKYRIRRGQISRNKFKMLYRTFIVYWSVKQISVVKRVLLFLMYAMNGVAKRIF
jgi:teichuronic acid biosynthesis glycosyltransferase TuaG